MKEGITIAMWIMGSLFILLSGISIGFWWSRKSSPNGKVKEEANYKLKRIAVVIGMAVVSMLVFFLVQRPNI